MAHNRCKITAFRAYEWAIIDKKCRKIDDWEKERKSERVRVRCKGVEGGLDNFALITHK